MDALSQVVDHEPPIRVMVWVSVDAAMWTRRGAGRLACAPVLLLLAFVSWGCLGTLGADRSAETLVLTPADDLNLPVRERHSHWLLRGESGWCGAEEVRYGGDPADPAVATVRTVVLRDTDAAVRGFARLTPAYLYSLLRGRMNGLPRPMVYPERLDGDDLSVLEYDVRLPLIYSPDFVLTGQLTTIRAGRTVTLIESIGAPPERLVPAVREIVRAAYRLPPTGC